MSAVFFDLTRSGLHYAIGSEKDISTKLSLASTSDALQFSKTDQFVEESEIKQTRPFKLTADEFYSKKRFKLSTTLRRL
jgi:hypothetical protein